MQDLVRFRCGGSVGQLGHELGLDPVGVVLPDHAFERRRDQHRDIQFEQLFVRNGFGAGESYHGAGLTFEGDDLFRVEAVGVVDPAARV